MMGPKAAFAVVALIVAGAGPPEGEPVRVVDPDGKAVAGARVYRSAPLPRSIEHDPIAAEKLAESGPDGVALLPTGSSKAAQDSLAVLVAVADGHGPAFGFGTPFAQPAAADGAKRLQLALDDVPIEGRLLDIEGRPVVGGSVQLVGIRWSPTGSLDGWLAALKAERTAYPATNRLLRTWSGDEIPALFPAVATDERGRFTIKGVGRERLALLVVSGPGIEARFEQVATRPMPTASFPTMPGAGPRMRREVATRGASFDLVAGPGLGVVGTVRDKDDGRPLPGIVVRTELPFGNPSRVLKATTDAEGRYRLAGVTARDDLGQPQGVVASSKDGPPYLPATRPVGEGRGSIPLDLALKRGAWARGRVVDGGTGRPVRASLSYFIPLDNPRLADYPSYGSVRGGAGLEADERGEFRIAVIPGRGILAARIGDDAYRIGVGSDGLAGLKSMGPGRVSSLDARPTRLNPSLYNALVEVAPKPGEESIAVEIALDRGRTVRGTLVGPGGEPVAGAFMLGATPREQWGLRPLPSAEFEARSLGPGDRRGLVFSDEAKGLAGALVVQPGEPGPLTVRLGPAATWTGRLVDDDGRPLAGVAINANGRDPINLDESRFELGTPRAPIRTDAEGRFRLSAIVPGLKYTLFTSRNRRVGFLVRDAVADPGEVKDLGDLRAVPPPRP